MLCDSEYISETPIGSAIDTRNGFAHWLSGTLTYERSPPQHPKRTDKWTWAQPTRSPDKLHGRQRHIFRLE